MNLDDIVILEVEIGQFGLYHRENENGKEWFEPLLKEELEELLRMALKAARRLSPVVGNPDGPTTVVEDDSNA